MKVTPAHDHADFLLSQRHTLARLTVIGGDGRMTPLCGPWLEVLEPQMNNMCSHIKCLWYRNDVDHHLNEFNESSSALLSFSFFLLSLKGVKRFDARQLVVDALVEKKLFRGKRDHAMTLPICR